MTFAETMEDCKKERWSKQHAGELLRKQKERR